MIRTVALLGLVASASASFGFFEHIFPKWEKDLRVRFDARPSAIVQNKAFMQLPLAKDAALKKGWEKKTRPDDGHEGFGLLVMLCPKGDYTLCCFYDETGHVMGVQAAMDVEQFTNSIYDWETQGFTYWTTDNAGTLENYWTTQIYFCSPEYLLRSVEDRIATRDDKKLLQDKVIYVSGINGKLHSIPVALEEIANTAVTNFTRQACMPLMGNHYYYQMTPELQCNSELFPFFPLEFDGWIRGIGIVMYGKNNPKKGRVDYCEYPSRLAVKAIVPRGPECLYDLADEVGLVTMHIYFIHKPWELICPIFG